MKTAYAISKRALTDLDEIWLFTYKQWSREQADRYLKLLMDEFDLLLQTLMPASRLTMSEKAIVIQK